MSANTLKARAAGTRSPGAPVVLREPDPVWPTARLRAHPRASLVPDMRRAEYAGFLAEIERHGILSPLEITPDGVVLDGRHRLRAARELGLERVPVRLVSPTDPVEHILLRALAHRELTPSQRAALAIELETVRNKAERARQRQHANLRRGQTGPEVATLPPREGKTRSLAALIAGVGERTVQDAFTVRQADPALFERIRAGTIAADVAARQVRRARRDTSLPPAPPLPHGPFEIVYADPPWQLGNPDGAYAPENHYPTLPHDAIASLNVPAADDAVLFLWAVNGLLPQALQVMEAWGFTYKTNLVWVKPSIGLGAWTRNRHELLLLGRRGRFPCPDPEDLPDSVIEAPRGRHSEKPTLVCELIERMYPDASKLELFARGAPRTGWASWGNEVEAA